MTATPAVTVPRRGGDPLHASRSTPQSPGLDADSQEWLVGLRSSGHTYHEAVARLHALLLKAARYEVNRRKGAVGRLSRGDVDDLAQQAADDALVAVLRKLDSYRGASRFTTWVYKFALYEAAVRVRSRGWQNRELPLEAGSWLRFADDSDGPQAEAETSELLGAVSSAVDTVLTAHQREVLVAVTLNEVPIDVLAERLNTTRGALYKTLHDGRRKLRAELSGAGLMVASGGGKVND